MVPDKPQKVENFHFTWCGYIGIRTRYYVNGVTNIFGLIVYNITTNNNIDRSNIVESIPITKYESQVELNRIHRSPEILIGTLTCE